MNDATKYAGLEFMGVHVPDPADLDDTTLLNWTAMATPLPGHVEVLPPADERWVAYFEALRQEYERREAANDKPPTREDFAALIRRVEAALAAGNLSDDERVEARNDWRMLHWIQRNWNVVPASVAGADLEWRPVVENNRYGVSNSGLMRSAITKKVLKQAPNNKNYLRIGFYVGMYLTPNGKRVERKKNYLVHRLVYRAFKGEIPEGIEVNHNDRNRQNNWDWNLSLMTHKENCQNLQPYDPDEDVPF